MAYIFSRQEIKKLSKQFNSLIRFTCTDAIRLIHQYVAQIFNKLNQRITVEANFRLLIFKKLSSKTDVNLCLQNKICDNSLELGENVVFNMINPMMSCNKLIKQT